MNPPCAWLVDNYRLLPHAGDALDVACGRGRHAIWLAESGLTTMALDRDRTAIEALNREAERRGLPLRAETVDLENGQPFPEPDSFDVIVGFHYLHRPLFPALVAAL